MSDQKNQNSADVGRSELSGLVSQPFALYEDYEHVLHIIDSATRVVLTDNYAYDATPKDKIARMEALVAKLNAG